MHCTWSTLASALHNQYYWLLIVVEVFERFMVHIGDYNNFTKACKTIEQYEMSTYHVSGHCSDSS